MSNLNILTLIIVFTFLMAKSGYAFNQEDLAERYKIIGMIGGSYTTSKGTKGLAILSDKSKNKKIFLKIGDPLPGFRNVKLIAIADKKLIFSSSDERLVLQKAGFDGESSSSTGTIAVARDSDSIIIPVPDTPDYPISNTPGIPKEMEVSDHYQLPPEMINMMNKAQPNSGPPSTGGIGLHNSNVHREFMKNLTIKPEGLINDAEALKNDMPPNPQNNQVEGQPPRWSKRPFDTQKGSPDMSKFIKGKG